MSSTDPTTTEVLRIMGEARRALAHAARRLTADADAAPDLDDLMETAGEVAALSQNVAAINTGMVDAHAAARQRGIR